MMSAKTSEPISTGSADSMRTDLRFSPAPSFDWLSTRCGPRPSSQWLDLCLQDYCLPVQAQVPYHRCRVLVSGNETRLFGLFATNVVDLTLQQRNLASDRSGLVCLPTRAPTSATCLQTACTPRRLEKSRLTSVGSTSWKNIQSSKKVEPEYDLVRVYGPPVGAPVGAGERVVVVLEREVDERARLVVVAVDVDVVDVSG